MNSTRIARSALITAVAAAFLASAVPAANAKGHGQEVRNQGTCSKGADWKLKAKTDDGRLQVEYEVDSNVVGQTWSVNLKDNGVVVFQGTRTTLAPSGSFSLERRIADRAGSDTIVATASNAATGQTCSGRVVLGA